LKIHPEKTQVMKRTVLLSALLFSIMLLNAQNNVKVTVTREKSFTGSAASFTVIINGEEKGKLKNGSTETYSVGLQPGKPITVLVRSGLAKKEISVNPKPGDEVFLNTGLKGGIVTLDLVKGASIQQGTGETAGITADKKHWGLHIHHRALIQQIH
jgi:hypothetical protein